MSLRWVVLGSEMPTRPERHWKFSKMTVSLKQSSQRKSYEVPPRVGVPSKISTKANILRFSLTPPRSDWYLAANLGEIVKPWFQSTTGSIRSPRFRAHWHQWRESIWALAVCGVTSGVYELSSRAPSPKGLQTLLLRLSVSRVNVRVHKGSGYVALETVVFGVGNVAALGRQTNCT